MRDVEQNPFKSQLFWAPNPKSQNREERRHGPDDRCDHFGRDHHNFFRARGDASRFARQLIVQEAGIIALIERGVRVVTASGDDLTASEDPFKVAMRQIAGVFAQLEKARLVGKLKAARDHKRATGMKVERAVGREHQAGCALWAPNPD
jgi:hypothetical protein